MPLADSGFGSEGAAGGGRALVLRVEDGDVVEMAFGDAVADVLDGGDGDAGVVLDGLAAGVDAGAVVGCGDGFGPGEQVGGLRVGEAAAFFLVEEEDGVCGEAFGLAAAMAAAASCVPSAAGVVPASAP